MPCCKNIKMLCSLVLLCILSISQSNGGPIVNKYQHYLENDAVNRFREYLRIDTSQDENIKYAVDFWIRQATELGLPYKIYEPAGKPIFVITLVGSNPALPSIMLNSHMDVVEAEAEQWSYPPFDAVMDANGDIYARGTQDTKDVGIQYIEAIRRLKKDNVTLERSLHVTLMPDEETGGNGGMKTFVHTEEFKALNIGFALDEGLPSSDESLLATYVDRRPWQMQFEVFGQSGHGYKMPNDTAMEKAQRFINAAMAFRDSQKEIAKTKSSHDFRYTSVNINAIHGGTASNIIPSKFAIVVDMRLSTDVDAQEMQSLVDSWMHEAGNDTQVTYLRHITESGITSVDDSNPYWVTMKHTLNKLGIEIQPSECPATSDMIYVRNVGIPAIGFTTKAKTTSRIHGVDEYQNVKTFLRGIDIYYEIIKNLGNLPADDLSDNNNP